MISSIDVLQMKGEILLIKSFFFWGGGGQHMLSSFRMVYGHHCVMDVSLVITAMKFHKKVRISWPSVWLPAS